MLGIQSPFRQQSLAQKTFQDEILMMALRKA
jgi:hypothetical protein